MMHDYLLHKFCDAAGVKWSDEEEVLYWAAPGNVATINATNRLLWHQGAAYSLGAMFIYEKLVPAEMPPILKRLFQLGFSEEELRWFTTHITVDVEHAKDWLGVVEAHLSTYEGQVEAWRGALQRAQWSLRQWNACAEGCMIWRETGVPPHLPFRELRSETGI
jgi:pyrroloquinoline quinone (PQQ) biosynthesis protein C